MSKRHRDGEPMYAGGGGGGRKEMICFQCRQPGHHIRDCPYPRSEQPRVYSDERRGGVGTSDGRSGSSKEDRVSASDRWRDETKSLLVQIGDRLDGSEKSLEKNLEILAHVLHGDEQNEDFIIKCLIDCVQAMPAKSLLYATLLGLVNCSKPHFVDRFLVRFELVLATALVNGESAESVDSHSFTRIKLLARFWASLVQIKMVPLASLTEFLAAFLRRITEEGLDQQRSDSIISVVLGVLPWIGESSAVGSDGVDEILETIEELMRRRQESAWWRSRVVLSVFSNQFAKEDALLNLWNATRTCVQEGWQINSIVKVCEPFVAKLASAQIHSIRIDGVPSQSKSKAIQFIADLVLLDDSIKGLTDAVRPIDREITKDIIRDILALYESMHKEGGKQLASLELGVAVGPLRFMIGEVLFSSMLTLPRPNFPIAYYAAIIGDLFRSLTKAIQPVVGRVFNSIVLRLDSLNLQSSDALCQWFTLHLSNFQYQWPWPKWELFLTEPKSSRRLFIRNTLSICVRLAYWQKIRDLFREAQGFLALLPPEPLPNFAFSKTAAPTLSFASEASQVQLVSLATQLHKMMRDRVSGDDVRTWLDENVAPVGGNNLRLSLFVPTMLEAGNPSFSHCNALLLRYRNLLSQLSREFSEDPLAGQVAVATCVSEFWAKSEQHVLVIFGKLAALQLLNSESVTLWALSDPSALNLSYRWQAIYDAIAAMVALSAQQNLGEDSAAMIQQHRFTNFLKVFKRITFTLAVADESTGAVIMERMAQLIRLFLSDLLPHLGDIATRILAEHPSDRNSQITGLIKSLLLVPFMLVIFLLCCIRHVFRLCDTRIVIGRIDRQ